MPLLPVKIPAPVALIRSDGRQSWPVAIEPGPRGKIKPSSKTSKSFLIRVGSVLAHYGRGLARWWTEFWHHTKSHVWPLQYSAMMRPAMAELQHRLEFLSKTGHWLYDAGISHSIAQ